MTAGNQPGSTGQINAQVTAMCLALRNDFQNVLNFSGWLAAIGGAAFLESIGFTAADAAVVVSTVGNLAALAAVYQGGAPGAALNYSANGEILWGGQ
jgi:hypothetical protein